MAAPAPGWPTAAPMRPPTAAPPKAPIPAPFSRVVIGPPAHPTPNVLIKAAPAIIPSTLLAASDLMFMLNILLCALDGWGTALFTSPFYGSQEGLFQST